MCVGEQLTTEVGGNLLIGHPIRAASPLGQPLETLRGVEALQTSITSRVITSLPAAYLAVMSWYPVMLVSTDFCS